ncbi:putative modular polyketide synthase [Actinacidiphila reveromycinica]|uniref:Putative modular polyketide synthase n=1 Tax=Actinacidiphila reveromycinica TaxID=659352 RepID=A0A7U3V130_9ACTN|nr:type I polyketide synthase [Streptomyces sp. SN-593]BBB02259.1 putative modular polyketide synthase [Streptomyces sp. SN-593]
MAHGNGDPADVTDVTDLVDPPDAPVRPREPIAVIGMACRLPMAPDPASYLRLLRAGDSAIISAPAGRPLPPGPQDAAPAPGGYLDAVDTFDAEFFGISPREAEQMDPRQRLALELGWEALEDAGIVPADLTGRPVGVFAGALADDYATLAAQLGPAAVTRHSMTGLHRGIIANRISYALGLRGPSLTIDSGQSSSLVAVHLACESLRTGESRLALAGGVQLNLAAQTAAAAERFGGLSPRGRCHTFDARADGFVRGEGGGFVVLKPLAAALADGDRVLCVVRGSAVNNDGPTEGLTVPSAEAQEAVIRTAHRTAAVDPGAIRYVELHGTGTRLGDPIEAAALGAALGARAAAPVAVGSVKTNIGHLEGAAGIAGLLKAALSVAHRELFPSLNFTTPHPAIPLDALHLKVQTAWQPWPAGDREPVAGVSAFGMGGTNCHVVLSAAPDLAAGPLRARTPGGTVPLVLSARSAAALRDQARRLADRIGRVPALTDAPDRRSPDGPAAPAAPAVPEPAASVDLADVAAPAGLADIAFSLATTRSAFAHRAVVLADDGADPAGNLAADLADLAGTGQAAGAVTGRVDSGSGTVLVFPGQGSQWPGMAAELLDSSPEFAAMVERCAAALAPCTDWSLVDVLRGAPGAASLDRVDVVQPALFAMMVSLAEVWRAHGLRPAAVIGHSQGEIAAAFVAGALSLEDAARIVALRSAALTTLAGSGGMASVPLPAAETGGLLLGLTGRIAVAAVNGPGHTVVSGDTAALDELIARCQSEGVDARRIPVDYASHSAPVDDLHDRLVADLAGIAPRAGRVPFYSTVDAAEVADTTVLDASYWFRNLRRPVRFDATVRLLLAAGHRRFVEVSPHPVLAPGLPAIGEDAGVPCTATGTLRRDDGGRRRLLVSLAAAYVSGAEVDWTRAVSGRRVPLPTYPFQRERFWLPETDAPHRPRPQAPATSPAGPGGPATTEAAPAAGTALAEPSAGATPVDHAAPAASAGPAAPAPAPADGFAALPPTEQLRRAAELVRTGAAHVLGHRTGAAVDEQRSFKDLGFDSMGLVELRDRLDALTGLRLPASVFFSHATPAALAGHLRDLLAGAAPGGPRARTAVPAPAAVPTDADAPDGGRTDPADDPVVIVGMGCRFPGGVRSPEDLWELVRTGTDAVSPFPADRGWDLDRLHDPDPSRSGTSSTRHGGFLEDAAGFDAGFFGISPREALAMDPQQRLLLETSWEAVERAGIRPHALRGEQVGVFVGVMAQDYGPRLHEPDGGTDGHLLTGSSTSVASGRIAYALGLRGPAVTVDTACSSSLVALHLAATALRQGECRLALAGGATVMSTPGMFVEFSRQRGLSPDGRCRAFSADADGTGWAEGAGVLVLERRSDALRHGHRVLAVLRGAAVNQDGASNGLTAPNGASQEEVVRRALAAAGLAPGDVDAVEAHGTGTALGDPVEAQALLAAYGQGRPGDRPLRLGSLKSNIGHAQAAAGVGGVIKMVQALRHGELPATLHVREPTPHVDWSAGAVELLTEAVPWPRGARPRRAGVSSFGISGTNAHVILEEGPAPSASGTAAGAVPADGAAAVLAAAPASTASAWPVSARTPEGLAAQAARLRERLAEAVELAPVDVAWSLASTRSVFEYRAVVVGSGRDELVAGLAGLVAGEPVVGVVSGEVVVGGPGRVVFVFPGQGSQWVGMGAELAGVSPVFGVRLAECEAALAPFVDWSLREVLAGGSGAPGLDRVDVVQPVLWAVMVSLAAVWEAAGVVPDAVVGHSQGEIAAAVVAGVLSLEDGARVVALRSQALRALAGRGGMMSIAAGEVAVRARIASYGERVSVAALNGPAATVVSGDPDALEELAAACEADGVRVRVLPVDYASHSPQVEELEAEIRGALDGLAPRVGRVRVVSSLTGGVIDGSGMDAGYWYDSLRSTVRFGEAVAALVGDGHSVFVETSPHPVLTAAVTDTVEAVVPGGDGPGEGGGPVVTGTLRRDEGGAARLLASFAEAYVRGVAVDWSAVLPAGERVDLPTYAFQRQRYWAAGAVAPGRAGAAALGLTEPGHPLLGAEVELPASGGVVLAGRLSLADQPWLADHVVSGRVLVPGTVFAELAVRAAESVGASAVGELVVERPLPLPPRGGVQVRVSVEAADERGRRELALHARPEPGPGEDPEGGWAPHVTGFLTNSGSGSGSSCGPKPKSGSGSGSGAETSTGTDPAAWPPPGAVPEDLAGFYPALAERGLAYGPAFRGVRAAWRRGDEVFAEVDLPDDLPVAGFAAHPALLDAALHVTGLVTAPDPDTTGPLLPFAWTGVAVHATGATAARVRVAPVPGGEGFAVALADPAGAPLATIDSLVLRARPADRTDTVTDGELYRLTWVPAQAEPAPADLRWALLGADGGLDLPGAARYRDLAALSAAAAGPSADAPDIVVACCPSGSGDEGGDAAAGARATAAWALDLVQGWLGHPALPPARLMVVTRNAVDTLGSPVDPAAAPVWGLLRAAQTEHPDRFLLADLDHAATAGPPLRTGSALDEPQFAVRRGEVLVPRLARAGAALPLPAHDRWRLAPDARGSLDDLAVAGTGPVGEGPWRPLAPGEVRVGLRAAGVNFRDVLTFLDMIPAEHDALGLEGAGHVLETGPGVTGLAAGDRVMGLFGTSFGPVAIADARVLAPVPPGWTLAQAAAAPAAYLTAWHALVELARLRPQESVLVHAATGGVGLAAVHLARLLGARVYGTAGPGKWQTLRDIGLDDDAIASSRTLEFEERFRSATGGRGVDVVLDSLAGEFVDASLRVTARGGRFVEMGKTDLRDPGRVRAAHGVEYEAIDLLRLDPARIGAMTAELTRLFADGSLPPLPVAGWDVRRAPDAFRYMSQARHVGKVVLALPAPWHGGTVLITGASGLLGTLVARHLAAGARRTVLLSRRGPAAAGTARLAAELAGRGVAVHVAVCDVADRAALAAVLAAVPADAPLRAVVHAAGALDDGVVGTLTAERNEVAMRPKIDGAWHLHELTRELDLGLFVLFSSVAGTWGNAGQAAYGAANTFLDALAAHRRDSGLPATSLAWGPWRTAGGMTGHLTGADWERMARTGLRPLTDEEGLALLDAATRAGWSLLVPAPLDLARLRAGADPLPPMLSGLVRRPARRRASIPAGTAAHPDRTGPATRLAALPPAEREEAVRQLVRGHAAAVLGLGDPADADRGRTFRQLGFDSLTAVELRNRLGTAAGVRPSATVVFDYPTPAALTRHLLELIAGEAGAQPEAPRGPAAVAELDRLEAALAEVPPGDARRPRIVTRLEAILHAFRAGRSGEAGADEEIDTASDDEIFSMIDRELGI